MTRMTDPTIASFLAFGNASIAICEVNELVHQAQTDDLPGDLLLELSAAHGQLRELFADGLDDAVIVLARDVMELASETTDVLNQDQGPSVGDH